MFDFSNYQYGQQLDDINDDVCDALVNKALISLQDIVGVSEDDVVTLSYSKILESLNEETLCYIITRPLQEELDFEEYDSDDEIFKGYIAISFFENSYVQLENYIVKLVMPIDSKEGDTKPLGVYWSNELDNIE
jgi:hypothetical protein